MNGYIKSLVAAVACLDHVSWQGTRKIVSHVAHSPLNFYFKYTESPLPFTWYKHRYTTLRPDCFNRIFDCSIKVKSTKFNPVNPQMALTESTNWTLWT